MSVLALTWIDSIHVGNSTAKALLRYLATHNFHKPGFFFKISTYAKALEVAERSIRRSFELLEQRKFITIERRFDENGRQITNGIYFNIPDEFITNYERKIEESPGGGEADNLSSLGVTQCQGGGGHNVIPYNNKRTNNKTNNTKSVCSEKPLKPDKPSLCPEDFTPKQNHYEIGQKLNIDVDSEAMSMIDWSRSKGEKRLDWDRTFNNWLRNEQKFNRNRYQGAKNGILIGTCKQTLEELRQNRKQTDQDLLLISQMG